jgi:Putative MetA-pathway of phenol degradation
LRPAAERLGALCLAVTIGAAGAAAAESERIQPDRPSVSTSASTVEPGAVQIESGTVYSRTSIGGSPAEKQFALELTWRVGLTERLEVRLEGEPLVVTRNQEDDTGLGDLTLDAKYRFFDGREDSWLPSLGVMPFVTLPVAHAPHGTNTPDFGLIGLVSFDFPWGLSLDTNLGLVGRAQRPNGYLVQGVASAALGLDIGERWSTFAEVFFTSAAARGARDSVGFDAGVQFFLSRVIALDAAGQTSLAGPGPDYLFRAGLSVRFGR